MNKQSIIEYIHKQHYIEDKVLKCLKKQNDPWQYNAPDLIQDIYLSLLEKNEEYLNNLYNQKALQWFTSRMITNNIFSKTSPYHKKYRGKGEMDIESYLAIKEGKDDNEEE